MGASLPMAAVLRCEGKPSELVLVELQSYAIMEDASPLAGQGLGVLEVKEDKSVTITQGPRTLYGKMQDLKNPLVLMQKTARSEPYKGVPDKQTAIINAYGIVR